MVIPLLVAPEPGQKHWILRGRRRVAHGPVGIRKVVFGERGRGWCNYAARGASGLVVLVLGRGKTTVRLQGRVSVVGGRRNVLARRTLRHVQDQVLGLQVAESGRVGV